MQLRVEDLDVARDLKVSGSHVSRTLLVKADHDGLVARHSQQEVLEVQDDVGDVFLDSLNGVELVQGIVEAQLGDSRAGDRREQRAPQRVAEGVAEAGVKGSDGKLLTVPLLLVDGLDGRTLDDEHGAGSSCVEVERWVGYLEYSSTMSCSWTGSWMFSRIGG